ncbi:MAG: hypothetical protein CMJ81_08590 [Planctomycetaceae bacterium]|nr:hypothetical protein [Planctomycetaceae bacterium]
MAGRREAIKNRSGGGTAIDSGRLGSKTQCFESRAFRRTSSSRAVDNSFRLYPRIRLADTLFSGDLNETVAIAHGL